MYLHLRSSRKSFRIYYESYRYTDSRSGCNTFRIHERAKDTRVDNGLEINHWARRDKAAEEHVWTEYTPFITLCLQNKNTRFGFSDDRVSLRSCIALRVFETSVRLDREPVYANRALSRCVFTLYRSRGSMKYPNRNVQYRKLAASGFCCFILFCVGKVAHTYLFKRSSFVR